MVLNLNEALEKAYAKSTGETIREHTDKLHDRLRKIMEVRGNEIIKRCPQKWQGVFGDLVYIVIEYHDYGKLNSAFQKKLCYSNKNLKEPFELNDITEIPHNFLSPCFLSEDILRNYNNDDELLRAIIQAIAYHHDRDIDERMFNTVIDVVEKDLERFKKPLFLKYWQYINPQNYINPKDGDLFKLFVLLKGILHRVDYTASADIEVEIKPIDMACIISKKLEVEGKSLNELQKFVKEYSDKNLLVVAPTGFGKTEAGVVYINNEKGFFVLPLRVSINSIYDRLKSRYGIEKIGLMHSTSIFKLIEEAENIGKFDSDVEENISFERIYKIEQEAKNLSFPFSITTPDQIFPFAFKYPGFERVYSTLGYSKVVIDEIQMYNPRMLAYVLKGIQAIMELGGKVMIMTATFPKFLEDIPEGIGGGNWERFNGAQNNTVNSVRHHLRVEVNKSILEDDIMNEIIDQSKRKKVLVICNTVNRAIEVYGKLNCNNKFLLHSRFIQKHRKILENKIQQFAPNSERRNNEPGVWITTQIVEVSLDVDFDILYSELSSIDSLIQRMGRVNRLGRRDPQEPNVVVCCEKCSGIGTIYDKEIFENTKNILQKLGNEPLSESQKVEFVNNVYSSNQIKKTKYYEKFEESLKIIDEIWQIGKIYTPIESIKQAQKQFREIFTITIIPQKIFSTNSNELKNLAEKLKSKDFRERLDARRALLEFTVDIPVFYLKQMSINITKQSSFEDDVYDVYVVPLEYDFDEEKQSGRGLLIELDESSFCD
ncbi:MAG: CRISPR-associated helicase Cas3' [Aquificaceae bacterium]